MTPKMRKPLIADQHGNNYAVICRSCTRTFIVSGLLDSRTGERECPHCEMYTVTLLELKNA